MIQRPMPPVWVVNLKRSVDRRDFIRAQLKILGVEHEIVEAVDGREVAPDELERCYSPSGARTLVRRELTPGEIGCSLSHLRLYQRQVDEGHEEVLILEDDIVIEPSTLRILANRDVLPPDWELVLFHRLNDPLVSHWGSRRIGDGFRCVKFASFADGTQGYLLRLSGARKLLAHGYPVRMPADSLTGGWVKTGLRLYGIDPPCIREFSSGPAHSTMPENYAVHGAGWPSARDLVGLDRLRYLARRSIRRFNPNAVI